MTICRLSLPRKNAHGCIRRADPREGLPSGRRRTAGYNNTVSSERKRDIARNPTPSRGAAMTICRLSLPRKNAHGSIRRADRREGLPSGRRRPAGYNDTVSRERNATLLERQHRLAERTRDCFSVVPFVCCSKIMVPDWSRASTSGAELRARAQLPRRQAGRGQASFEQKVTKATKREIRA